MLSPELLLLDEPLGALDPLVRAALQKDPKGIFAQLLQTALFVTHDLAEAIYFGDEIVLMNDGRVVQKGSSLICVRDQLTLCVGIHQRATRSCTGMKFVGTHLARPGQPNALLLLFLFLMGQFSRNREPDHHRLKKIHRILCLGEIARRALNDAGVGAEHRQGMGGTIILWQGLRGGQIDAYPEYTGTIGQEILKNGHQQSFQEIRDALGKFGVGMTEPLGFNNTYALVMRRSEANAWAFAQSAICESIRSLDSGLPMNFLTGRMAGVRCTSVTGFLTRASLGLIMRLVMSHWLMAQLT